MTASLMADRTLDLRTRLLQTAMAAVSFGALTSRDGADACYFVAGINETAKLLRPTGFWTTDEHLAMQDAFGSLCEKVAELADFDNDPDGYMDRLGRPARMGDVVRGAILADREHWTERLIELSR